MNAREIADFEKRGISVNTRVYFASDPGFLAVDDTERYEIIITKRNGVATVDPKTLEVRTKTQPDASAGLGILFKVLANETTSRDQ